MKLKERQGMNVFRDRTGGHVSLEYRWVVPFFLVIILHTTLAGSLISWSPCIWRTMTDLSDLY